MPDFSFIIYISCYLLAGSFLTAMISHIWINRKLLHLEHSLPLLVAGWFWLTSQLFEYIVPDTIQKMGMHIIQYTSISIIPVSWLGFCIKHTEMPSAKKNRYLLLILPAVVILIFIYLNPGQFLWNNIELHRNRIYLIKDLNNGIFILMGYVYIYFIAGTVLMIRRILHVSRYEKRQTIIILLMAFFPFLVSFIDYSALRQHSYVILSPLAIAASSLFIIYFARLRYYRTIPLTQHIVTQSMLDICLILNPDDLIIYCNPATYRILGLPVENVIGKPLSLVSGPLMLVLEKEELLYHTNLNVVINNVHYHAVISPIYNRSKRIISRVVVLRDITSLKETEDSLRQMKDQLEILVQERTRALEKTNAALVAEIAQHNLTEKKLKESLAEKNILLGEIHHRVKNNLQVIISMLKLQKKYITDEKGTEGFNAAISRIRAIAIIHEKLYKSDDLANTDLAEYIKDLVRYLIESHKPENMQITLNLKVDNIYLDLDRSILSGLIINELVINALKYAFPPAVAKTDPHKICVYFLQEEEEYMLSVKDNGVGLPEELDITCVDSLGMKIVLTLANQLSGKLTISRQPGTEICIRFKK